MTNLHGSLGVCGQDNHSWASKEAAKWRQFEAKAQMERERLLWLAGLEAE